MNVRKALCFAAAAAVTLLGGSAAGAGGLAPDCCAPVRWGCNSCAQAPAVIYGLETRYETVVIPVEPVLMVNQGPSFDRPVVPYVTDASVYYGYRVYPYVPPYGYYGYRSFAPHVRRPFVLRYRPYGKTAHRYAAPRLIPSPRPYPHGPRLQFPPYGEW